jgi:DNA repair protein RecO (recombination protein O)
MFQPAAILDMVVYHQEQHNLQRIKEYKWWYLYREVYAGIIKTTLVMYMTELLYKCLKQPETHPDLYAFVETSFIRLDNADEPTTANFILHFTLALASGLGFRIGGSYSHQTPVLDLQEGVFSHDHPAHGHYLEGYLAEATALLLAVATIEDLSAIRLNREMRRALLQAYQSFYVLHLPDFGTMRSLGVLQDIMD